MQATSRIEPGFAQLASVNPVDIFWWAVYIGFFVLVLGVVWAMIREKEDSANGKPQPKDPDDSTAPKSD